MIMHPFHYIERQLSLRLDCDLAAVNPGALTVIETPRRLQREASYGYVRAGWWLRLEDGRSVFSLPPGAGDAVRLPAGLLGNPLRLSEPAALAYFSAPLNETLAHAGRPSLDRAFTSLMLACDASRLRERAHGDCRRLTDSSILPADGLRLPEHCFPDGIVYGIVADDRVVSVAFAHRTGILEDRVADLGVETAPAYRRRGCARTAVAAVVRHITVAGGEACYYCRPDNAASIATARSVGFIPFGATLILAAPWVDCGAGE